MTTEHFMVHVCQHFCRALSPLHLLALCRITNKCIYTLCFCVCFSPNMTSHLQDCDLFFNSKLLIIFTWNTAKATFAAKKACFSTSWSAYMAAILQRVYELYITAGEYLAFLSVHIMTKNALHTSSKNMESKVCCLFYLLKNSKRKVKTLGYVNVFVYYGNCNLRTEKTFKPIN